MPPSSLLLRPYGELAVSAAAALTASRDRSRPFDPWPVETIVASSGVARAISEAVIARIPEGVAGLRLQTIESLALRVLNDRAEYPRPATPAERRLAMRTATRAVDHPMMETRGTAAMLERSYRDVRDSGLGVADVASRARNATLRDRERFRAVIRAWEEYERLIAKLGASDPADILLAAASAIRSGAAVRPQVVAGFYDMTGAQFAVIDALRFVEKLHSVYVPVVPGSDAFSFALPFMQKFGGADLQTPDPQIPIRKTQWTATEHRTREEEARETCRAVATQIAAGTPARSIGVVARSLEPYDVHVFDRFAREFGFRFSTRGTTPLAASRIGRGLILLLRLRERDFPRGDVLELVRSGFRVETRINADKADIETRRALIAGGTSAVLAPHKKNPVLADYMALVEELEKLTQRFDASSLSRIVDRFRAGDRSDLAAIEALDDITALFARAERWNRPFDTHAVIDAIEQATIDQVDADNDEPQIWLGDVMRLRGRTFAELFVVRMQDDVLPQRRTEDPLLPDSDRRLLGIREIGNGREEEALLFELMRGASVTHFSYASSDGFGKPLRPSQSLKAFAIAQEPEKKTEILKRFSRFVHGRGGAPAPSPAEMSRAIAGEGAGAPLRPLQLLVRAGTRSVFDGYIDSPVLRERVAAAMQSVSPTQLEDFGECPQKFLLKHLLGVFDVDDPDRQVQINHREKGSVDHRILERFYNSTPHAQIRDAGADLPRLASALVERLDTIVDDEFDLLADRIPAANRVMREMERRATKRILRDFLATDIADLLDRDLLPAHFEYRFGRKHRTKEPDHPEPFIVDAGGVPIRVEGTIDRIDRGSGDRFRIVDYKSGKALRHADLGGKIDRGVRLQLPLYAMAVASFFEAAANRVAGAIKPLVRGEVSPEKFAFELGDAEAGLRETLRIFVSAIHRGDFPAFPNESENDFQSCKYCPVSHSCRTKHDADERRSALEWSEPRAMLEGRA